MGNNRYVIKESLVRELWGLTAVLPCQGKSMYRLARGQGGYEVLIVRRIWSILSDTFKHLEVYTIQVRMFLIVFSLSSNG